MATQQTITDQLKEEANSETTLYNEEYVPTFNSTVDLLTQWTDIEVDINNDIAMAKKNIAVQQKQGDSINEVNVRYRGAYYESQGLDYLKVWDMYLNYIYYFFAVVLIISLFLAPNTASVTVQVVVALFVLLYPYVSIYIVKILMRWLAILWALLPNNVYINMKLDSDASRA
jgi:hypothetical protein